MWSAAYITILVTLLLATESPEKLRRVALPYLLSTLVDLDHVMDITHAGSASSFVYHPLHVHGLSIVAGCYCISRFCALVSCHSQKLGGAAELMTEFTGCVGQGLVLHYGLHLLAETTSRRPIQCIFYSVAAWLLLAAEYWLLLRHKTQWQPLYQRIVIACLFATIVAVAWLVVIRSTQLQSWSPALQWWVNGLVLPLLYAIPVFWLLRAPPEDKITMPQNGKVLKDLDEVVIEICPVPLPISPIFMEL